MANFLDNIMGNISGAFAKKGGSVVGIDIGSSFLKIVQLKKKGGKAVLETYGELALGPYAQLSVGQATSLPSESLTQAIRDLFKEANVTTSDSGMSIPLGSSLLSVITMPALDDKQLARMIPIEARKYIPVPISEVTLDWWVVPNSGTKGGREVETKEGKKSPAKGDTIDVLVVAIHNDVIGKYKEIIKNVPLQNSFLELEVFSASRSTFGSTARPVMIFDMGAGTTKLAIIEYGVIKSQHIINRGSQDITRAISQSLGVSIEKAETLKREVGLLGEDTKKDVSESVELTLDSIFADANRVLLNYQRKYNKTIGKVVLAGGGVMLRGFHDRAQKSLETDVEFADPFSKVETPAFLEPVLKDAGPEFAVAIGVALRQLQEME